MSPLPHLSARPVSAWSLRLWLAPVWDGKADQEEYVRQVERSKTTPCTCISLRGALSSSIIKLETFKGIAFTVPSPRLRQTAFVLPFDLSRLEGLLEDILHVCTILYCSKVRNSTLTPLYIPDGGSRDSHAALTPRAY